MEWEWKINKKLPSTTGRFITKASKASGVAFNISSNALIVWLQIAAPRGVDKVLDAAGTPSMAAFW